MAQGNPIKFQEITKLTSLELSPECFKFGVCNMESDLYISAKEKLPSGEQILTIIELQNGLKYNRKPNKADGVIMHPFQNIIALKAKQETGNGCVLQIFDMDKKEKLKSIDFPESITFWKWINQNKLACITQNGVFYVDISKTDNNFQKVMEKYENLKEQGTQIIGYCSDSQEKWGALYGIGSNDGGRTINGYIQLYLIQEQKQQMLEGHCCTFGQALIHNAQHKSDLFCFVEKKQNEPAKLHITEISAAPSGYTKFKKNTEMNYQQDQVGDFPIFMQISSKYGVVFVVTKLGYFYLFEIASCSLILRTRVSQDTVFVGTRNRKNDGILCINKAGSLFSVSIDDNNLVPFIINCNSIQDSRTVGISLATRYGLPGADGMFLESFNKALINNEFQKAAQIAASSPGTLLRNSETINKLKQISAQPGQPQPILIYFQTLLEKGQLNKQESIELVRPVILQGKKQLIENWLNENKLECSEELGDLIKSCDSQLAIKVYEKSQSKNKLMQSYMETGQMDKAMQFSSQLGVKPDYNQMIKSMIPNDPQGAMTMAIKVCTQDQSINVFQIAEAFLQNNRLAELTQFLLECMKGNKQEDAAWQTQVLELNLMAAPQVADAILNMEIWNQFNKQKIAVLCEQKGLYQKALENYQDIKDIKRICLNAQMLNLEWLVSYIGKQTPENGIMILQEMIRHNRQNMQIVVQVCANNYARFQIENCIKLFESVSSFDGLFYFLGGILQTSSDKEIHYKYIEAAVKVNQLKEVERVVRDKKECYDPIRVKDFLKQIKLADPIPLIVLCDQHGFVDELIKYLYKNNFNRFIEIYILKYNPNSSAVVLGTLIDLECEENYLKQILYNLRGNCALEPLIAEFEKRNRLRVLENWLESRIAEGNQLPAIHNAIAKIKIDSNQDPQNYLLNNQFYDSKIVGQYCEDRDPHLAYTAYKRAWGQCDNELIEVTNKNALYRLQAKYLVERQSKEVWALVLDPENQHRKAIIEQVVSAALPDSKNVEEVSCTVQAFMQANLPLELLSLLEKIVLHNSEFGQYKKLQHLLIITAIKSDSSRVMDYIKRLDKYDGPAIAVIAIEHELYEEAFEIYRRQNCSVEALSVLLSNIGDINRAGEFAEKVGKPEVWSQLGHAYLNNNLVEQAIDCYLKCNETSTFSSVILYAEQSCNTDKFISYLTMARLNIKDQIIDNALCFVFAKENKLNELEELLRNPNSTDVQRVGDRCYEEKLYQAAKLLFINIKNNAKIASCLVRLGQFQAAIDSAKKANSPKTWKELCFACIDAQEFRLAATAGLNIIIHPDHLEDISLHYEQNGFAEQMIELLQQGMQTERAHIGIFTELGSLFAKYQPEKLMEHCVQYFSKINVSKLLRVCERYLLWAEAVYLYSHYDEFDNAINVIIEHSPSAFQHEQFINLIQKVSNQDLYYKAILFYMEEQPMQVNGLLKVLSNKIDLTKTVQVMKRTGYLPLITPFMKSVQSQNNQAINEALNEIYFENEDFESLRKSITTYDNFDQQSNIIYKFMLYLNLKFYINIFKFEQVIKFIIYYKIFTNLYSIIQLSNQFKKILKLIDLAKITENHQMSEMRRIAAYLYRSSQRFDKSMELSKKDKNYKDCIETAAESEKADLIENLLRFFVQNNEKEFFTVCTYTCYDYIKPDVVLELAWRYGLIDFAMPFMIQVTRELTAKLDTVQKKHQELEKKEQKQAQQLENQPLDIGYSILPGMGQQMLMAAPQGQNIQDLGFGQAAFQSQPYGQMNNSFGVQSNIGYNPNQFGTYN